MKKMRKLIPALAMLLVSAVMMSTASFAWFSMSTEATATGMQVQAKADAGILISNGDGVWASNATTTQEDDEKPAKLLPVSTLDASVWYYNTSSNAASANANNKTDTYGSQDYAARTTNYYLYNTFYIKSSSNEALNSDLQISNVTITESSDLALNEAARVLVKCGNTVHIYSITGKKYSVLTTPKGDTEGSENKFTEVTPKAKGPQTTSALGLTTIPNVTATATGANNTTAAVKVEVFVYFEGEDAACMSSNLLDAVATLTIDLTFTTKALPED